MGFSLKRALAGAIAGAAGAVGGIADARIKEAQQERERQQAFERQRELLELQDEIAAQREQRVEASKQRLEDAKIERMGGFMKDSLASLRESGIDPGSALGQRKLAEMALENKQPALADRFFDNANRMDEMKDRSELRKMELGNRMQIASLRRGSSTAGGNDYEKGVKYAESVGGRIAVQGRDGKPAKLAAGPSVMGKLYRDARENGMSDADARALVNDAHIKIDRALRSGENPDTVIEAEMRIASLAFGAAAGQQQQTQQPPPPRSTGGASGSWDEYTPSLAGRIREKFGFERAGSMGFNDVMPK